MTDYTTTGRAHSVFASVTRSAWRVRRRFMAVVVASLACGGLSCASDGGEGSARTAGTAGDASTRGGGTNTDGLAGAGGTQVSGGGGSLAGAFAGAGEAAAPALDAFDCRSGGDGRTTLTFVNRCAEAVTYRGSDINGGELAPSGVACVDLGSATEELPSKRYWGWSGSDPGAEHHTLAEFTFNTDFYDFDWYNISHVDAHNLPMQLVPVGHSDCEVLTCAESLLAECPSEGRFADASGEVVACVSPDRDNPESAVARHFESCDDAYAWSGDDQQGSDPSPMYACAGEDWDIVFCPVEES